MSQNDKKDEEKYSDDEIHRAILLLNEFVENSEDLASITNEQRIALLTAAGKLSRPDKIEARKRIHDIKYKKKQRVVKKEKNGRTKNQGSHH